MIRTLFLVHRYLGIGLGLLMAMWCVSGLVMLYVSYPAVSDEQRAAHLPTLRWDDCCRLPVHLVAAGNTAASFQIEMLAGDPVLDLGAGPEDAGRVDMAEGTPIVGVTRERAGQVAEAYAGGHAVRYLQQLNRDQWTLEGIAPDALPLYRFAIDDPVHTQIYISSRTGRVVQLTTRNQRFWNWFGPIPHWLYFTGLRSHAWLWAQAIIYTSLAGCFLTVIGLYLGLRQLWRAPAGRWSAYRGFNLWHHVAGVVFGILSLTWVLSGLLSMNPWGWLQSGDASAALSRLHGAGFRDGEVRGALQALIQQRPSNLVSVRAEGLQGRLYLLAMRSNGERLRLDDRARPAPLNDSDRGAITAALGGPMTLITQGDDYYFSHHSSPVRLPVYRVVAPDAVRYYLDPISGTLLAVMDGSARGYRWWHQALHRMDFSPWLRGRPQWDVLMWVLMCGVTLVCMTGAYLGMRRILG